MGRRSLRRIIALCLCGIAAGLSLCAQEASKTRVVGTVTSVDGDQITVKADIGAIVTANVGDATRIIRAAPGQKDLSSAPTIPLADVHPGDRMLVSGFSRDNGHSIDATTLVVMSSSDLAQRRTQEQQAWQSGKRGVVTAVDAAARRVTLKSASGSTDIQVAPSASVLRYRDGSSKFAEAQPASFDQIKVGDQLQAKGPMQGQAQEKADAAPAFVADAVIFGTFANIAGRITAVDPANSTVTVNDVFTKKLITLHLAAQSQMRQVPQMIAQRIATAQRRAPDASDVPASNAGNAPNRPFDFQQVIARSPTITIADLHKGDAIIAVAGSEAVNSPASYVPAFYVIVGVEPILTASPSGSGAAALLASWNLSGNSGEGE